MADLRAGGGAPSEDYDVHVLASASVERGYLGWWTAASRHGFTTQVPWTLHVATDRPTRSRIFHDTPVRYVRLVPRQLFGWETMASYGREFRISTPCKTLIDCLARPDLAGGPSEVATILSRGARTVPVADLVDAALAFGSVPAMRRLGCLLDLVVPGRLADDARSRLSAAIPNAGCSVLGRPRRMPGDVGYVPAWGVSLNVPASDLLADP